MVRRGLLISVGASVMVLGLSLVACSSSTPAATPPASTAGSTAGPTSTGGSSSSCTTTTSITPEATPSSEPGTTVLIPASATTVNVTLGGASGTAVFGIVATPTSVKAGDVAFVVKNGGKIDHEMLVLKTDTAPDHLPIVDSGDPPAPVATCGDKVDEETSAGETGNPNLKAGDTRTFVIEKMTAGKYVLVCNLATHYGSGMRAAFTVT
jgi:uncharacterized cupredoxin-like copper-binding protein